MESIEISGIDFEERERTYFRDNLLGCVIFRLSERQARTKLG